jgi:hypothetical protein
MSHKESSRLIRLRQIDADIVKPGTRAEGVGSPREAFGQKGPFLDRH